MYQHRYRPPPQLANKTATVFAGNKHSINSYPSSTSSSYSSQANNNNNFSNVNNRACHGTHNASAARFEHSSNHSYSGGLYSSSIPNHLAEERQDVIFRRVRGILNKITPETFDKLSKELVNVGLDSPRTLRGVIYLLFDKALKDLKYSSLYAKLCQQLSDRAPNFEAEPGPNTFCKFLISKCEDEFERRRKATEDFDAKNELTDEEYEQKAIVKQKMLGNIKFICELGKKRLLREEILHECIRGLLSKKKERPIHDQAQNLECLCQIMRTIGSLLDVQASRNLMNQYFERIDMFSKQPELPSRIRFMLRDVIDLRNNNWRPRPFQREENVPQPLSKLRAESGFEPSLSSSTDKHGNIKEFVALGDLAKLHKNKFSMLLDDDGPDFTTSADLHWGPAFLPLNDAFDEFASGSSHMKQNSSSIDTKDVMKLGPFSMPGNHSSKQRNLNLPHEHLQTEKISGKSADKLAPKHETSRHTSENRRINDQVAHDKRCILESTNSSLSQTRIDREFSNLRNRNSQPPLSTLPNATYQPKARDNLLSRQDNGLRRIVEPNRSAPMMTRSGNVSPRQLPRSMPRRPPQEMTNRSAPTRPAPLQRAQSQSSQQHHIANPNGRSYTPRIENRSIQAENVGRPRDKKANRSEQTDNCNINQNHNSNINMNNRDFRPPPSNTRQGRNDRFGLGKDWQTSGMPESESNLNWRAGPKSVNKKTQQASGNQLVDHSGHGPLPVAPPPRCTSPKQITSSAPENSQIRRTPSPKHISAPANGQRPIPITLTKSSGDYTSGQVKSYSNFQNMGAVKQQPLPHNVFSSTKNGSISSRPDWRRPTNGNANSSNGQNNSNSNNINAPNLDAIKEPLRSQNLSPLLKPSSRVRDGSFSLRPSHNLVGRPANNAEAVMQPNFTSSNMTSRSGTIHANVNSSDNLVSLGLKTLQQQQQQVSGKIQLNPNAPTLTHSSSLPQVRLVSDVQNGTESKPNIDLTITTKPVAEELYVKKFSSSLKVYSNESGIDFNQLTATVRELKIPKSCQHECLLIAMKESILKSESDRENVSNLLTHLIPAVIDPSSLVEAFKIIFDQLHALEVETPKVKSLVAGFLSRAVFDNLVSLEEVGKILDGGKHHPLFLLFLQRLEKHAGQPWLNDRFVASKIELMKMLPEADRSKDRLASVLKDRCLGFLDPMLTIEPDLWEQMKERDPSPNAIYRWIKENVDPAIQVTQTFAHLFVSCLIRYITSAASGRANTNGASNKDQNEGDESNKSSPSLSVQATNEEHLLTKYQQVLQAVLKDKEMQLAALYSLQLFYYKLDFPKGSLLRKFHLLYEMNVVDDDVFFIWKEEINDKFPGKGQALFQVNTWLNWLAEAESEEEDV